MTPGANLQTLTLAEDLTMTGMGYGAMQVAGPGVFGPPKAVGVRLEFGLHGSQGEQPGSEPLLRIPSWAGGSSPEG